MPKSDGTAALEKDELLAPFEPVSAGNFTEVAEIHERYPALARFREQLGGTSLMEVPSAPGGAAIVAKCEWENPAGSIKDRAAYALICEAVRRHGERSAEELRIVEYSGGNLGLALSYLCAEIGLTLRLVVASFTSASVVDTLRQRGTLVDIAPEDEGFLGTVRGAQRIAATEPGWELLFQHANPANLAIHELTTGQEMVHQLAGRKVHTWLASIGTGGTLIGVMNALRRVQPDVRTVGITPAEAPYGHEGPPNMLPALCGAGGFGHGIRQPFVKAYDDEIAAHYHVPYREAMDGAAEFFGLTGIRLGTSASANWLIARRIAATLPSDAVVATVFASSGTPEQWAEIGL
jgi:cysteine synthase A